MENKNITTGEIVRALHKAFDRCDFAKDAMWALTAADRLKSQEHTIAALTARAEQAEQERDAAVANINLCMDGDICKACVSWKNGICSRKDNRCDPKYRGLQQKNGEEK